MSDLKMKGKKMGDHLDTMLKKYKRGEKIGFTALARLKARGLILRADGSKKKRLSKLPSKEKYQSQSKLIEDGENTKQMITPPSATFIKRKEGLIKIESGMSVNQGSDDPEIIDI